jgi:hypothetical protein
MYRGRHDASVDDALAVLRREFDACEGSFLLRLRSWLEWDPVAFSRLERAMRAVCQQCQEQDRLERWMAEGFYDASRSVRDWTSHPNFPRPEPAQYYQDCIERLDDLADWFFRGWHNYQEPHVWRDL